MALVREGISLSLCIPDIGARVTRAVAAAGRDASGHFYIDTGMSRMGLPYHSALPVLRDLSRVPRLAIAGMMTELAEEPDFDTEQVRRLSVLAMEARAAGMALLGGYPTDDGRERSIAELTPAFRLKARVVRVAQMRAGDTVSYGRRFKADAPTWIATLPVGHADAIHPNTLAGKTGTSVYDVLMHLNPGLPRIVV
ncbi:MAG: alanine racemase [Gemmatimonadetes bacterium]|nr:alanine racemase [Gemmatimonadota bacterium]